VSLSLAITLGNKQSLTFNHEQSHFNRLTVPRLFLETGCCSGLASFGSSEDSTLISFQYISPAANELKPTLPKANLTRYTLARSLHLPSIGKTLPVLIGEIAHEKIIVFDQNMNNWCGPCLRLLPSMKQFHKTLDRTKITIVRVCYDDDEAKVHSFIKTNQLD
jgi:thiol-disulfide isomerase/thioredoxin